MGRLRRSRTQGITVIIQDYRELHIQVHSTWTAFLRGDLRSPEAALYFLRDASDKKTQHQGILCKNLDRFQITCKFGWLNLWSFWAANKWFSLSYPKQTRIPNNCSYCSRKKYKASGMILCFIFLRKDRPLTPMHLSVSQWPVHYASKKIIFPIRDLNIGFPFFKPVL